MVFRYYYALFVLCILLLVQREAFADESDHHPRARSDGKGRDDDDNLDGNCAFATPQVINIFGAKPPQYLLFNASADYLRCQQPLFRVLPAYRPIQVPETVSSDGIEMLLRGFGDIASSGRFIAPSDFTALGCNPALVNVTDGSSSGPCNGRTLQDIRITKNVLFFYVDPSNPVKDITFAQLSQAVNAILAGQTVTWSQLYPNVSFSASLANAQVRVLNGPPGGGLPVQISKSTGVPVISITPLSSASISAVQTTSTNWLYFSVLSSTPSVPYSVLTYNSLAPTAAGYTVTDYFHAIIDVNNPRKAAVKDFLCYLLTYQYDGSVYQLFPLDSAIAAEEKAKLGCPEVYRCTRRPDGRGHPGPARSN